MSQRLKILAVLSTFTAALAVGGFAVAQSNATPPSTPQRNTTERDPNAAATGTTATPMPNTSTTAPSPPLPLGTDGRSRDPMANPRTDGMTGTTPMTPTAPMTSPSTPTYDANRSNTSNGTMNNNNGTLNNSTNGTMNDSTGTPMLPARRDRN